MGSSWGTAAVDIIFVYLARFALYVYSININSTYTPCPFVSADTAVGGYPVLN